MDPVSSRLLSQQLQSPEFDNPVDLVSWFGAVQAQDYRMMRWAVGMRTKSPSHLEFEKAYNDGRLIRHHLMRGTWQLVCGDDFPFLLDLFGVRAKSSMTGWLKSSHIAISEAEWSSVREILIDTAQNIKSLTTDDFDKALKSNNINLNNQRLTFHLRFAEVDGILTSGDLHPTKPTYSLAKNKIRPNIALSRDESLKIITKKYFQSHQPATLEDFAWWSGLPITDCKKGISLLGDWLHIEKFGNYEFYVSDDKRTEDYCSDQYLLLPPYDEYLIGYKSRDIVLNPEHSHFAHNNSGNFSPVVVHNGLVCGNWSITKGKINPEFFPGFKSLELPKVTADKYLKFKNLE